MSVIYRRYKKNAQGKIKAESARSYICWGFLRSQGSTQDTHISLYESKHYLSTSWLPQAVAEAALFEELLPAVPLLSTLNVSTQGDTVEARISTKYPADRMLTTLIAIRNIVQGDIRSYLVLKEYLGWNNPTVKQVRFMLWLVFHAYVTFRDHRASSVEDVARSVTVSFNPGSSEGDVFDRHTFGEQSLQKWMTGDYSFLQPAYRAVGRYERDNDLRDPDHELYEAVKRTVNGYTTTKLVNCFSVEGDTSLRLPQSLSRTYILNLFSEFC